MGSSSDIQGDLPLTEATFLLLLSLASGPRHGYAMMKDVQGLSRRRVVLSTGTLYGAIKRLVESNWIERYDGQLPDADGRARKEYRLTELGRRILQAESERLQGLVAAVRMRSAGEQV